MKQGANRLVTNLLKQSKKLLEERLVTSSICTARVTQHVNKHTQTFTLYEVYAFRPPFEHAVLDVSTVCLTVSGPA